MYLKIETMKKVAGIFVMLVVMTVTSFASVTFDATTGLGFVGKGDVQNAFGWNNAALQSNAAGVSFTYDAVDIYEVTVEWTTGEGKKGQKTHVITVERQVVVSANILSNARTHKQIDGFRLTGIGTLVTSGNVPVVGANFNDGNDVKPITAVTLLSSTGGALSVNYGGVKVAL